MTAYTVTLADTNAVSWLTASPAVDDRAYKIYRQKVSSSRGVERDLQLHVSWVVDPSTSCTGVGVIDQKPQASHEPSDAMLPPIQLDLDWSGASKEQNAHHVRGEGETQRIMASRHDRSSSSARCKHDPAPLLSCPRQMLSIHPSKPKWHLIYPSVKYFIRSSSSILLRAPFA